MNLTTVPKNLFGALAQFKIIPTIIFAIMVGILLIFLRSPEDPRIKRLGIRPTRFVIL